MYKESELTGKIIGVAINIHKKLGPGFKEEIYHQAMIDDLIENNFIVESEQEFDVIYKNKLLGVLEWI